MVYKRYIKRNGKTFGPYYYESYRDEEGKTRTKLVSVPRKNKFPIKFLSLIIIFSLFLAAGFILLNSEKTFKVNSSSIKSNQPKILLGNFIKLIGFQVSQWDDPAVPSEEESLPDEVPEQSSETENLPDEQQKIQEKTTQNPEINIPSDISTEENIETETNQTEQINPEQENFEQNISEINQTSPKIPIEPVTAQSNISNTTAEISIINETIQNISEINQTITENFTITGTNQTIQGENFTINEKIIQYSAKLGEPVKWKKTLKIEADENKTLNNLEVTLPKTAGEVSVRKIFTNNSIEELEVNVKNEKIIQETEPVISITGQVVKNKEKDNIFNKIFKFFRNFVSLVGRVIDVNENEKEVLVNIQEELENNDEIEIEYYTEAPYSEEIVFNNNHKKINIVGSGEVHYENILAFSNLSKEVSSKNEINLYWLKNDSKELMDFNASDLNENGEIDYIEWIVPSLSNQTYEIILITKAQHLDTNKNFISDIYESVKALDGNWSEQINDSEYVRITFEENLTSENDITIYPRTISPRDDSGEPNGTLRIEVYEFNKTEIIAEFTNIIDNEYNKVYLTNLNSSQNTFDLKILGGSVEFDYIVDPFTGPHSGNWMDLSANDTGNWAGTDIVYGVAVNPNENLVYTALNSGKFGAYNHSNGVWMDLSANDTGNWGGVDSVLSLSVNTNDNLVYTALGSGKFGVYNHSNGVWMDLSANDTGDWVGTTVINDVAVNPNDNLVYTVLKSGKFGVYNHSNGVWMDLSANDTGNWVGATRLESLAINPNDNLVYTGLFSGKFGAYNHSNGVWMDLSANDTGNWAGTDNVLGVAVNTNDNLIYTGLGLGKFGVYNHSNGVWMNLSANDTGNWVGTDNILGVAVNTNNNLIYTGIDNGKFGAYNNSNGVWMDLSANDTGDWVGSTDAVYGVSVNTNDNLVYTALKSGKFGVYRADLFPGAGAGTLGHPYEITDCVQLQNMSANLNANYELVNNIDCSDTINWNGGAGFLPVGVNVGTVYFSGSLQGNDYNITNLHIKNNSAYVGMFGYTVNATINKVHLLNVFVSNEGTLNPNVAIGGLVGAFDDNGTIANSSVHGNVTSKGTTAYTGGLAGWLWDSGAAGTPTIYNSSFTGNISATGNSGIGGLVGWSDGIINYSFANVKLNSTNSAAIGGLVGTNALDSNEAGIIDNSYSLGNVSVAGGSSATRIGGLVGDNYGNIIHSYSAANVSGNTAIGGLVGNNVRNVSDSYSCGGNVKGTSKIGGFIGTTQATSNVSFSYSANVVSISEGTTIGGFAGRDEGAGAAKFNFSFYDSEIDGGNYDDIGFNGNHSGIYDNTTAQMKKSSTYTALGWDFTNVWRIAEDYSYPYFKWQTTPACGIPVPPIIVSGGGSGNSPDVIELLSGFKVAPTTINVILNKTESKTECFTITSTGTLSLTANLNAVGEIIPFTSLTNSVLNIPVQNSKSACAVFSADEFDIPENYTGQIEVSAKEKKYINVALEIREKNITTINITNVTTGILPIGIINIFGKIGFTGILPLGESFLPPGYDGILPVGTFPTGILPVEKHLPLISKNVIKAVGFISLWILLLLLVIIYLAVKRFVKLQDQLSGYKSREDKLAMMERLKRSSSRKEANVFEKIIDKGTIYLSEKTLGTKNRKFFDKSVFPDTKVESQIKGTIYLSEKTLGKKAEQKSAKIMPAKSTAEIPSAKKTEPKLILSSLPAYATERYKRGAEFYSLKEYGKALKEFEKAVETDTKFWQAYQGIGSCYLAKDDKENAKKYFEKSLSINPKNEKLAEWMRKQGMKK